MITPYRHQDVNQNKTWIVNFRDVGNYYNSLCIQYNEVTLCSVSYVFVNIINFYFLGECYDSVINWLDALYCDDDEENPSVFDFNAAAEMADHVYRHCIRDEIVAKQWEEIIEEHGYIPVSCSILDNDTLVLVTDIECRNSIETEEVNVWV